MPLSGHCLCKAVTYKVDIDAPLLTGYDHCDDCQRQSGSTYSLVVVVPKDKLEVKGPVKKWKGTADSGNAVWRWFCEECGSPIAHDPDAAPEIIALKGGSLDTELKKDLKPDTEIWTASKLPFCQEHLAKPFVHMPHDGEPDENKKKSKGKAVSKTPANTGTKTSKPVKSKMPTPAKTATSKNKSTTQASTSKTKPANKTKTTAASKVSGSKVAKEDVTGIRRSPRFRPRGGDPFPKSPMPEWV